MTPDATGPETAAPCALCGTTGGYMHNSARRPARVDGRKYGVPGVLCYSCYQSTLYRFKHNIDTTTGERKRLTTAAEATP